MFLVMSASVGGVKSPRPGLPNASSDPRVWVQCHSGLVRDAIGQRSGHVRATFRLAPRRATECSGGRHARNVVALPAASDELLIGRTELFLAQCGLSNVAGDAIEQSLPIVVHPRLAEPVVV